MMANLISYGISYKMSSGRKPPLGVPQALQKTSTARAARGAGEMRAGTGWVALDGEPKAAPSGTLTIIGARPGVDGSYLMNETMQPLLC